MSGNPCLAELHITPDIVAMPPGDDCDALVNPANEALQGTKFDPTQANAKFPNSGGRVYPEQTIDGAVSIAGGTALYDACQAVRQVQPGIRCPVGAAVATPAFGELLNSYDKGVVHVVAPKLGDFGWERRLVQSYWSALDVAWGYGTSVVPGDGAHMHPDDTLPPMPKSKKWRGAVADGNAAAVDPSLELVMGRVAMPLLGAGTRGLPLRQAAQAAAEAVADYTPPPHLLRRVELDLGEQAPVLYGQGRHFSPR